MAATLSDAAKAEIIGVLTGGFLVSAALLTCLVCPCPLREAAEACIARGRSGTRKPQRSAGSCCCCCFTGRIGAGEDLPEPAGVGLRSDTEPSSEAVAAVSGSPKWPLGAVAAIAAAADPLTGLAGPAPRVALTFSVTRLSDCLAVHLHGAEGTPGARLGLCHCNFAVVQTVAINSSSSSSASAAAVFADETNAVRTGIVGQTASPVFNETLVLPLPLEAEAASSLLLQVRCLDYDRFSRERVVGEVRVPLPTAMDATARYESLPMELPQSEAGALLVALHYMPTAERLSVIMLKANGVYASDGSVPTTYLHVVLLASGSAVYKKRTRIFDATPSPVYNESVTIDLPRRRLDRVSLMVSVINCHLRRSVRPDLDSCLGYVVFSSGCYGSGGTHWLEMVSRPRTPLAYWHRLA